MTQLFDVHAHLQFRAYKDDADEVIKRAREAGVKMIVPSSEMKTAKRGIEYAEKYPNDCWAAVGLHPIHLKPQQIDLKEDEGLSFKTHGPRFEDKRWRPLAEHERVVAIGEIGLDYVERLKISENDRVLQEETFRQQIELAIYVEKPIIVHSRPGVVDGRARDSNEDVLAILEDYASRGLRGLMHCYSGNLEQAKRFLELGFYLSFTGLITFNHSWDEVICSIPLNRILTETDAPYLTPVPHRGKRNEPAFVRFVAEYIAKLRNETVEHVAQQTTENAFALFGLSR